MTDQVPQPTRLVPTWPALAGVVLLALAIRLPGLTWGLPDSTHLFSYHPDEYHSLRGLFSFVLAGDLNPHFFNYGSLYLYLVLVVVLLLHPGAALTAWAEQIATGQAGPLLREWMLDARLVSLVASLVTVYVVARMGQVCISRTKSTIVPYLPAALFALAPLSALTARYGTVDATQALFICLSLYFSVLLFTRPTWKTALWAGASAGLAASTKYNGGVVLVAPLLAAILAPPGDHEATPRQKGKKRSRDTAAETPAPARRGQVACRWVAVLAGAAIAFALTSPYTFLAWGEARAGLGFELEHMRQGESLAVLADPSAFLFHLKHLLAPGLGLPVVLAMVGAVWVLARRRQEWYPLLLFVLVWVVMISLARVRYPRYELPLIAPLVLLAVAPLEGLVRGRRLYGGLLALSGLLMLFWCGQVGFGLQGPRPQDRALTYLLETSRPGQTVGFTETPWYADPPVNYCNGGKVICSLPLWRQYAREARPVVVTGWLLPASPSLSGPAFFVTTDFGLGQAVRAGDTQVSRFLLGLATEYREVASEGGTPLTVVPWPLGPDWRYPWPRIEVWQHK